MKVGFACLYSYLDKKGSFVTHPEYKLNGTTVTALRYRTKDVAEEKLWDATKNNVQVVRRLIEFVGNLDPALRIVRIGSDVLPVYTHPDWSYFYKRTDVRNLVETELSKAGKRARELGVKLSFHPGQFTTIVSDKQSALENSLLELEYHGDLIRWMGYGQKKLDFKLNIHLSGKLGPAAFESSWKRMSPEVQNTLTLENDEFGHGLDDILPLGKYCGIVLDIHHHFIRTGEYIESNDSRIQQVVDSWRGNRPTFHYSQSSESLFEMKDVNKMDSLESLLESGYKKGKLRTHSHFMWNRAQNDWAKTHLEWGDCMVEAKGKNLASFELAKNWGLVNSHLDKIHINR